MKIFLEENGRLIALEERSYRDREIGCQGESTLQERIEKYPELIPSEDINPDNPPDFIVLKREASVPGIGSIDLLLSDQDGILTILETKLADHPEIMREVVGQVLEYAAHESLEWDVERVLQEAQDYWNKRGTTLQKSLEDSFGADRAEGFWNRLSENVRQGQIRIIIASDKLPQQVRRVIEFLNNMSKFEIYGLEIGFHADSNGRSILATRLVGQSERAIIGKRKGRLWDLDSFFKDMELKKVSAQEIACFRRCYDLLKDEFDIGWGQGIETGTFVARLDGRPVLYFSSKAYISAAFLSAWSKWPELIPNDKLEVLRKEYESLLGRPVNPKAESPSYLCRALTNEKGFNQFTDLIGKTKRILQESQT